MTPSPREAGQSPPAPEAGQSPPAPEAGQSPPAPSGRPDEYVQPQWALPAGATQVVLVRHGASAPAVAGRPFPLLDGHGDPPLSDLGRAQADRVAERLRSSDVAALFVTPLVRTVQTAAPLARRVGVEPVVVPELREVLLGEWEGGLFRINVHEGHPLAARMLEEERWDVIPGAEPMAAFAERVGAGLRIVAEAVGPNATGVAFVHAGVIAEACRQASGSRPFAFVSAENGSMTRLVVHPDGRFALRSFNETGHLQDSGRPARGRQMLPRRRLPTSLRGRRRSRW